MSYKRVLKLYNFLHASVTATTSSLVKDVTMCILYSLVACCDSKSQHCILFRSKFDLVIYDIDRNRMLRLNDRAFESSDDRANSLSKRDLSETRLRARLICRFC